MNIKNISWHFFLLFLKVLVLEVYSKTSPKEIYSLQIFHDSLDNWTWNTSLPIWDFSMSSTGEYLSDACDDDWQVILFFLSSSFSIFNFFNIYDSYICRA